MGATDNKALVRRLFEEGMNERKAEIFNECVAPNAVERGRENNDILGRAVHISEVVGPADDSHDPQPHARAGRRRRAPAIRRDELFLGVRHVIQVPTYRRMELRGESLTDRHLTGGAGIGSAAGHEPRSVDGRTERHVERGSRMIVRRPVHRNKL